MSNGPGYTTTLLGLEVAQTYLRIVMNESSTHIRNPDINLFALDVLRNVVYLNEYLLYLLHNLFIQHDLTLTVFEDLVKCSVLL